MQKLSVGASSYDDPVRSIDLKVVPCFSGILMVLSIVVSSFFKKYINKAIPYILSAAIDHSH